MVLPVLPVVGTLDEVERVSGPLTKNGFRAIGQIMFHGGVHDLENILDRLPDLSTILDVVVDVEGLSTDKIIQLLDIGAAKVVVSKPELGDLNGVPPERILVRLSEDQVATPAAIEDIANSVAGIILDSSFALGADPESLKSIVTSLRKSYLPTGGERMVYMRYPSTTHPPTINELKSLALLSIEPIIPSAFLTSSPKDNPSMLSVAQITLLGAKTDRPDGLYSTIVVDERDHALGLVYSSAESIAETIRTGTGVYQSRERGLWYKGATSGATQEILGISWDCDADCLRYTVKQAGKGFCHLERRACFGPSKGLTHLEETLKSRQKTAPKGSYVARLFSDPSLLRAKIMEEAEEVCEASQPKDIAWEVADLLFFAMTKCVANGVSLADVEAQLDKRAKKISRRKGDAKAKWIEPKATNDASSETKAVEKAEKAGDVPIAKTLPSTSEEVRIKMPVYDSKSLSSTHRASLLSRPIQKTTQIMPVVQTIIDTVKSRGDAALLEYTAKFEKATNLKSPVLEAPFPPDLMALPESTKQAIDTAFKNIQKFHSAQLDVPKHVETMPGIICSRFARPIERVGLYVPGGTAVLPSTAMMLGIPALVAGCKSIQFATPPRADGTVVPEIVYIASKVGATKIVLAGGAQAVAALAYGTESVEKCDKIFGPGNQYVTAAKMCVQSDAAALVGVDLPAGPSEVLVVADSSANAKFVASDLLSQAEHGADSMVVLVAIGLSKAQLTEIEDEIHRQASLLPRGNIVVKALANSYVIKFDTLEEAMDFTNEYAPEHLILYTSKSSKVVDMVHNAGSVFVGAWSPVSCGDYASGTNHTLPTYGYAKMYSGVNTQSFQKHITSQELTSEGLRLLGPTVITLAEVEGLDAHAESVRVRMNELGAKM